MISPLVSFSARLIACSIVVRSSGVNGNMAVPTSCTAAWRPFLPSFASPLELHLRHLGGLLGDGKILHRLRIRIEDRSPPASWDGPDLGVVVLDRGDVVAPGDGDAV